MGFKGCMQPRVPLELGKLEGEEVVADELVNDVLHKRFKMILTRDLLLSVLIDKEGIEVAKDCLHVWIKLRAETKLRRVIVMHCDASQSPLRIKLI